MSFHNPEMPWSELERALSGRQPGAPQPAYPPTAGRRPGGPPMVIDPLAVDGDGGDAPGWSRKRAPYVPSSVVPATVGDGPVTPYAELHCHSNFSFLDGASHPEELVAEAARLGLTASANRTTP